MKVREHQFEVTYQRKKRRASVQIFKPLDRTMYRVHVPVDNWKADIVLIFYEEKSPNRFYFFSTNFEKDKLARSVMKKLQELPKV